MSVVKEPVVTWSPDQMIEVTLNEPDDFLKVRETLTRIGVASRKEKKIYQSCHILHKQPTVAGDLIVFPSTLVHSVDAHTIEEYNRYSLSFNAFPCGLIGNMERSSGIILEVL